MKDLCFKLVRYRIILGCTVNRILKLKEIIILYVAITFEGQAAKYKLQNFCWFLHLQGYPALLVTWMVFIINYLIMNTILSIATGLAFIEKLHHVDFGVIYITNAVIYFCKYLYSWVKNNVRVGNENVQDFIELLTTKLLRILFFKDLRSGGLANSYKYFEVT